MFPGLDYLGQSCVASYPLEAYEFKGNASESSGKALELANPTSEPIQFLLGGKRSTPTTVAGYRLSSTPNRPFDDAPTASTGHPLPE